MPSGNDEYKSGFSFDSEDLKSDVERLIRNSSESGQKSPGLGLKDAFKLLIRSIANDKFDLGKFTQIAGSKDLPYNQLLTALSNSGDISCRLFACEWLATLASVEQVQSKNETSNVDSDLDDSLPEGQDDFFKEIKRKVSNTPAFFQRKMLVLPQSAIERKLPEYLKRLGKWQGDFSGDADEVLGQMKRLEVLLGSSKLGNGKGYLMPTSVNELSETLKSSARLDLPRRDSESSSSGSLDDGQTDTEGYESDPQGRGSDGRQSDDDVDMGRLKGDLLQQLQKMQSGVVSVYDLLLFTELVDSYDLFVGLSDSGDIGKDVISQIDRMTELMDNDAVPENMRQLIHSGWAIESSISSFHEELKGMIGQCFALIKDRIKDRFSGNLDDTMQADFSNVSDFCATTSASHDCLMSQDQQDSLRRILTALSKHKQQKSIAVSSRGRHMSDISFINDYLQKSPIYNVELFQLLAAVSKAEYADTMQVQMPMSCQLNFAQSSVVKKPVITAPSAKKNRLAPHFDALKSQQVQLQKVKRKPLHAVMLPRLSTKPGNGTRG